MVSQRGKQPQGNPMHKVLGWSRKVRFAQSTRQACIREKKGPSLGKIQVKPQHQRSPYAMKFEDRSQEETPRQQRCVQSKAWNHIYKLKEKDMTTFYSPAEEWVLPAASTNEPEQRVCGRFRSECAYGQQAKPSLCRVGYHEDVENPTTVMTANGRGAKKRSHGIRQRIGLLRDSDASRRYTGRSLTRKALRRSRI